MVTPLTSQMCYRTDSLVEFLIYSGHLLPPPHIGNGLTCSSWLKQQQAELSQLDAIIPIAKQHQEKYDGNQHHPNTTSNNQYKNAI